LRSADQTQRPARRDWAFAYADPRIDVGKGGEARAQVVIAGDEVVLAGHSVFVPEAWQRTEVEREGQRQLAKISSIVVIALAAIAALIYAVVAWSKGRSDRRAFRWVTGISLLMLAGNANNWPVVAMQLKTAEPVTNQLVILILGALAGGLLFAAFSGCSPESARTTRGRRRRRASPAVFGVAAGRGRRARHGGDCRGAFALVAPAIPVWPDLKMQSFAWPWAGALTGGLAFIPAASVTLFLLAVVDRATAGWTRRISLAALFLVLFGVAVGIVSGNELRDALLQGIVGGLTTPPSRGSCCATTCAPCRPSSRRGSFSTARRRRRWPRPRKRGFFSRLPLSCRSRWRGGSLVT
jgi:hypothetical protein